MPDGRPEITDPDELMYRQVHPDHREEGRVTRACFNPHFTRDPDDVSVARASLTTPKAAFDLHISQGKQSLGTWAVSVGECNSAKLQCFEAAVPEDPAHASICFAGLTPSRKKAIAKVLASHATNRGCLHSPSS